jgi:hypothetical protein
MNGSMKVSPGSFYQPKNKLKIRLDYAASSPTGGVRDEVQDYNKKLSYIIMVMIKLRALHDTNPNANYTVNKCWTHRVFAARDLGARRLSAAEHKYNK